MTEERIKKLILWLMIEEEDEIEWQNKNEMKDQSMRWDEPNRISSEIRWGGMTKWKWNKVNGICK